MKTKERIPVDTEEVRRTLGRLVTSATVLADRAHAEPEHPNSTAMFRELFKAAELLHSACRLLVP